MEKLLVGLKEMEQLVAKSQNPPEKEEISVKSEDVNLDNIFIEPKKKVDSVQKKENSESVENPNKPVKKAKGGKRGISQLPDDELRERLAKMREKAAIVKKQKAEERRAQVEELKQLKLSQKLDIPVDTLAEYETIRKTAPNRGAPRARSLETEQAQAQVAEPKLDVDSIVDRLFQRIHQAKQHEDTKKQEAERLRQQQILENNKLEQIRKQKEAIQNQRNHAYFTQLGNGKIPKPAQQDQWMALFNRKK
jgi:hypothetical protein